MVTQTKWIVRTHPKGGTMRRFWMFLILATAMAPPVYWSSAYAQDATPEASPVASPAAEPSEEGLPPVEMTTENGKTTFIVVERALTDRVIDSPPLGDSLGDWLVFSNALYDETNTTLVGVDQGFCMRSRPLHGIWECTYTNILANGNIVVQGPFYDNREASTFAITGGTGDFAGAEGQMVLTFRSETELVFTFEIIEE
jgi:allene oxide cyclase